MKQITTSGELTMFIAKHGIRTDWLNASEQGVEIEVRAGDPAHRLPEKSILFKKDGNAVAEVDVLLLLKFATPYSRD